MLDKLLSSLGRLVSSAQPGGGSAVESDRRVWVRYPCSAQVHLQSADVPHSAKLSARVVNVSRGGIGLLVDQEFEPGRFLGVELPAPSAEGVTRVLAYIMHATPQTDGRWMVGCTFSAELTDDELQGFGARREKPAEDDQRSWVRFPCPVQASYQVVREVACPAHPAQVADISPSGLGLLVDKPVEVGTLLSVDLHGPGERGTLTILASVIRVTCRTDEWLLGCSFIRELSEEEMQALL